MPAHPAEEVTQSHIFDKVAKESSDSTASDHPIHDENKGPLKQATSEDHRSKGPQLSDSKRFPLMTIDHRQSRGTVY